MAPCNDYVSWNVLCAYNPAGVLQEQGSSILGFRQVVLHLVIVMRVRHVGIGVMMPLLMRVLCVRMMYLSKKLPVLTNIWIGGNVLTRMQLRSLSLIFQMSKRKKSGLLFDMAPNVHILKAALVQMQWGGLCGLSVAKYLHRFAEDIVKVETVWHPHSLAKQLYKENPDRAIVYRDKQLSYYIPSENHVE